MILISLIFRPAILEDDSPRAERRIKIRKEYFDMEYTQIRGLRNRRMI